MSTERINTDHADGGTPSSEERPRSSSKPPAKPASARGSLSSDDGPLVRLNDAVTGSGPQTRRPVPVPSLPPRAPAVPPSPAPAPTRPAAPNFSVSSFNASNGGTNAVLTTDGQLTVEAPPFTSSAIVHETSRSAPAADLDIGYLQTATSHFLEKRYRQTVERILVNTP